MRYNKYLKEEINEGEIYKCTVCGREVKILKKGQGPLICCMKQMVEKKNG